MRVLIILTLIVIASCGSNQKKSEKVQDVSVLDRTFDSLCESFEAVLNFALENHIYKTIRDKPGVLRAVVEDINKKHKQTFSLNEKQPCDSFTQIEQWMLLEKIVSDSKFFYQDLLSKAMPMLDVHSNYYIEEKIYKDILEGKGQDPFTKFGFILNFPLSFLMGEKINALLVEEVLRKNANEEQIKADDVLTHINDLALTNFTFKTLKETFESNNQLKLGFRRGKEILVQALQGPILTPPLQLKIYEFNGIKIAYIKLRRFNNVYKPFKSMLEVLEKSKTISAYVFDLRDNLGGHLEEAVQMADLFLDEGVITELSFPKHNETEVYKARNGQISQKPIVLLANALSASASEVFVGSLGTHRAIVEGGQTFGKGVGQITIVNPIKNSLGGLLVLTTFEYRFFDGSSAQRSGLTPHLHFLEPYIVQNGLEKYLPSESKLKPTLVTGKPRNGAFAFGDLQVALSLIQKHESTNPFKCTYAYDCLKERAFSHLSVLVDKETIFSFVKL